MTADQETHIDPITFEVIRNSLLITTEEMKSVVTRTAMNLLIKSAGDLSCGIMDSDTDLVAQGEGDIPILLATMPYSLKGALSQVSVASLEPGDILIHNNPYLGNNHLPDVNVFKPIFHDGEIIAYSAVKGHWADVGGLTPGGVSASAPSIFAEGMQIPPLKIVEKGRLNDDVMKFILANTRMPSYVVGDLKAELAGCGRGEENVLALVRKYGLKTVKACMSEILDHSEALTRAGIKQIKDGTYRFSDHLDGDGIVDAPITIRVKVAVRNGECDIDFTGTDSQTKGSMNAPYAVTLGACFYVVKSIIDPAGPTNSGCYRPIHVNAPEGTIVNPHPPAGVGGGNVDTSTRVCDCLLGALAQAEPNRVVAAGSGGPFPITFSGIDMRKGTKSGKSYVHSASGLDSALGAGSYHDGRQGTRSNVGNTGDIPIEVLEYYVPVLTETYEFAQDSGGPGKFRGGLALHKEWRALCDVEFTMHWERSKFAPYGLFGGKPGRKGYGYVKTLSGKKIPAPLKSKVELLHKGDVLDLRCAGGGGYGPPSQRDRALVLKDLKNGYVSRRAAAEEYGVKA